MNDELIIREETSDHRYFTAIPNIIDEMDLSPYAFRVYVRIKRRAGDDGTCYENSENLAAGCNMSIGQITKVKRELELSGLIHIEKRPGAHGHFPGHTITIIDVWKENIAYFDNNSPIHNMNRTYSPGGKRPIHQVRLKKIPMKKGKREEKENGKQPLSSPSAIAEDKNQSSAHANNSSTHNADSIKIKQPRPKVIDDIKKICNYTPPKGLWPKLEQLCPDGVKDMKLATAYFQYALSKGINPTNYNCWFIEWYVCDGEYMHPRDKAKFYDLYVNPKP